HRGARRPAAVRRVRSRRRDEAGNARSPLPPLLHHQAERQRPRAGREPEHRPRARRSDRGPAAERSRGGGRGGTAAGGGVVRQSVLIVDDEGLIRRSLSMVLEGAGYDVQSAASGADALAQLAQEPPDCVLIDLRLGDMDGLDVLRAARERVPMPKAIVITAHGYVDTAVSALVLRPFALLP